MDQLKEKKMALLTSLRNNEEIYVLFSKCTNMPYVHCDPESYNDQVFIFRQEELAKKDADSYNGEKQLTCVVKMPKAGFLTFYSSLYLMGINTMVVDKGADSMEIEVKELVIPPDYSKLPEGKVRVDNPGLQLTALYFMQELRKNPKPEPTKELREMEEEMIANIRRGTFILPVQNEKNIPMMKMPDGNLYQPIFTDILEFNKFKRDQEFRAAVLPYEKLKNVILEQSAGLVINPMGFQLIMKKEQIR